MTVSEFENGYWYLDDLRKFAGRFRVPAATRLQKDELERAILEFLRTGSLNLPTQRALRKTGVKDLERGLSLKLRIEHYTSNRETKDFIRGEAGYCLRSFSMSSSAVRNSCGCVIIAKCPASSMTLSRLTGASTASKYLTAGSVGVYRSSRP
jgi:hypothetical protein